MPKVVAFLLGIVIGGVATAILLRRKEELGAKPSKLSASSEGLIDVLQKYLQDRILYRKHTHFRHEFDLGDSEQLQKTDRSAVVKQILGMWDSQAKYRLESFLSSLLPESCIELSSQVGSVEGLHKVLGLLDNCADLQIVDQLESELKSPPDVVASYRDSALTEIDRILKELSDNA